ncbi:MAG: hypothetical protein V1826_01055 [bacterium]
MTTHRTVTSCEWLTTILLMPLVLIIGCWPFAVVFCVIALAIALGTAFLVPMNTAEINLPYLRLLIAAIIEYGLWVGFIVLFARRRRLL